MRDIDHSLTVRRPTELLLAAQRRTSSSVKDVEHAETEDINTTFCRAVAISRRCSEQPIHNLS